MKNTVIPGPADPVTKSASAWPRSSLLSWTCFLYWFAAVRKPVPESSWLYFLSVFFHRQESPTLILSTGLDSGSTLAWSRLVILIIMDKLSPLLPTATQAYIQVSTIYHFVFLFHYWAKETFTLWKVWLYLLEFHFLNFFLSLFGFGTKETEIHHHSDWRPHYRVLSSPPKKKASLLSFYWQSNPSWLLSSRCNSVLEANVHRSYCTRCLATWW